MHELHASSQAHMCFQTYCKLCSNVLGVSSHTCVKRYTVRHTCANQELLQRKLASQLATTCHVSRTDVPYCC